MTSVPRQRVEELIAKYAPHKVRSWEIDLDDSETSTNISFLTEDGDESFGTLTQFSDISSGSCSPANELVVSSESTDQVANRQQEVLLQDRIEELEKFCKDLEDKRQQYVLESHNTVHKYKMVISTQSSTIQTLKSKIADLQRQVAIAQSPTVEEWVTMQKAEIRSLFSPSHSHSENETADLSLRQYVQLLLLQATTEIRTKYQASCDEVDRLKQQCIDQNSEISRLRRNNNGQNSLKSDLEIELAETKAHLERVTNELTDAQLQLDKANLNQSLNKPNGSTTSVSDLENALQLLKLDKGYLEKQVKSLEDRNKEISAHAEELRQKNTRLKETQEELYKKLLSTKEDAKCDFEERLNSELQRISTTTNLQIEHLRSNQRESYEREITALRSARDHAVHETEKLNVQLNELKQQYDALLDDFRDTKSKMNGQVQELRSELKLKQFELDRQRVISEEHTGELGKLKLERERLQEKIDVSTKEYYRIKQETTEVIARLETENRTMRAKVESFDDLQSDLEKILTCQTANDDAIFSQYQGQQVKQNAALARRLVQKQADVHELEKKLHEADEMIQTLKNQLEESKNDLARTTQPYSFLIEELKKRDRQIKDCTNVIQSLQNELRRVSTELQSRIRLVSGANVGTIAGAKQSEQIRLLNASQATSKLAMENKRNFEPKVIVFENN